MQTYKHMPPAAKAAFDAANARRGRTAGIQNRSATPHALKKQPVKRDYRLTAEYRDYLADEREWREQRANYTREMLAASAENFLMARERLRLTARRLDLAQVKAAADKARIARARTPERKRATMLRHVNTITYSILKDRGLV